jgi:hypothetical protein
VATALTAERLQGSKELDLDGKELMKEDMWCSGLAHVCPQDSKGVTAGHLFSRL